MDYYEFTCDLQCLSREKREFLTAFLAEAGFESFYEDNDLYKAYIQSELYNEETLKNTLSDAQPYIGDIAYSATFKPSEDWNQRWEDSFESAEINDEIVIRTPSYQPEKHYRHEIIIQPRMAFGSGTHETTSLILQTMQLLDLQEKSVCDCGCGTGILGIFASQLGASSVFAFDYDNNSVENTKQNAKLNNVENITVKHASFDCMQNSKFDLVLANINRNILVEYIEYIANSLNPNGSAILSGFYSSDVPAITGKAESFGLKINKIQEKNNWTVITFIR